MNRKLATLGALLALGACATPEGRIRGALVDAGVPRATAGCMAERMVDRLSMSQLMKLRSVSRAADRPIGELSVRELVELARRAGDPEIVSVTMRAGISCAVL